jgi:hypothetical protein
MCTPATSRIQTKETNNLNVKQDICRTSWWKCLQEVDPVSLKNIYIHTYIHTYTCILNEMSTYQVSFHPQNNGNRLELACTWWTLSEAQDSNMLILNLAIIQFPWHVIHKSAVTKQLPIHVFKSTQHYFTQNSSSTRYGQLKIKIVSHCQFHLCSLI